MTDTKLSPGKFADSNVVSLDAYRDEKVAQIIDDYNNGTPNVTPDQFDAIMKANLERKTRQTAERAKNNEGVKRSYRLKSRPKK